jgi:orotidine-5'-phosphate decarboxylase
MPNEGISAQAYARAVFDDLGADAVTVSPYLGGDSLEPFLAYPDRGVFVLVKTSNPGGGEFQDARLADGQPLYLHVARQALGWPRQASLGLVVGATYPSEVAAVRQLAPDVPILLPGIGAQAGDLEGSVQAGADAQGGNLLVSASRSIMFASSSSDWQAAARAEADRVRRAINAARPRSATLDG